MKWRGIACLFVLVAAGCNAAGSDYGGGSLPANRPAVAKIVSLSLAAALDPSNGFPTFVYEGTYDVTPTIRVKPGDSIEVFLNDELPASKGMGDDVNLHFHGLGTSPLAPADDVLTMLATPNQTLHYVVPIPKSQPPGLYWYHTHVHGETNYQVGEGGMSGAIVVDGIEAHLPGLARMRENLLMVRELGSGAGSIRRLPHTANSSPCAQTKDAVISVNREYRPTLPAVSGQPAFYRVVNATGHRTLDLSIDGSPLEIVAIDGYPLDTYPGAAATRTVSHYVLPPAARVEFVAATAGPSVLRTRCYFSGPVGDPDPAQILAYLGKARGAAIPAHGSIKLPHLVAGAPLDRDGPAGALPQPVVTRRVRLTENAKGFYINGHAYSPEAPPTFVVHTGTTERWTVENLTQEIHAFHIHQVHFVVESINGARVAHRHWADTVVVPYNGNMTLLMDFRSPLIRGTFLFHCHILDHEDMGMMAKIQAI
ncbi:MAG TPA: multicopper oxidase domain-containing protein [Candidatus Baltobacteraceae bacterium]|jgi:FtsP/CotA-like multicopper oxidase with cupredoxin domain